MSTTYAVMNGAETVGTMFTHWEWPRVSKAFPGMSLPAGHTVTDAPSPLLRARSWLHPFKGHCEQQAMRDEGVIYVAGHPLLNGDVQDSQDVSTSEMTYIVLGGALNSTHSLTL